MKFRKIVLIFVFCLFLFTGCGKDSKDEISKKFLKKVEGLGSYHLNGILEIANNENSYLYDVDVSYMKDNFFRVSLINKTNNHEQIILRNNDGVYVLTPSLNKSFKFQSEWPYNNSQSYLLHNIANDIKNDSEFTVAENEDGYKITTVVNYSNNKELVKQYIYFDSNLNIYKLEVLDTNDIVKIKMEFDDIDYNRNYDINYFNLDNNMNVSAELDSSLSVSSIKDVTFPMYIPENTYLSSQDKVMKENGERVILTFSGDYPFMLIQETVGNNNDIVSVYGEPLQLSSSIGIIDDSSLTWINEGIEYYLVSNVLDQEQLIDVANSLSTVPISK